MKQETGLTLIEVMLAILLITIVLVIMARSQISSLEITRDSAIASEATQLANDITEAVQREVYSSFNDYKKCGFSGATVTCTKTTLTDVTVPADYSFTATVTGLYDEPATYPAKKTQAEFQNEGLIRLDVTVSGPSSLSFTSYLSCLDEQAGIKIDEATTVGGTSTTNVGRCPKPVDPV